eukprot:SAG22_NODE_14170_length_382_cov_1.268551_1_plen_26_part_10
MRADIVAGIAPDALLLFLLFGSSDGY